MPPSPFLGEEAPIVFFEKEDGRPSAATQAEVRSITFPRRVCVADIGIEQLHEVPQPFMQRSTKDGVSEKTSVSKTGKTIKDSLHPFRSLENNQSSDLIRKVFLPFPGNSQALRRPPNGFSVENIVLWDSTTRCSAQLQMSGQVFSVQNLPRENLSESFVDRAVSAVANILAVGLDNAEKKARPVWNLPGFRERDDCDEEELCITNEVARLCLFCSIPYLSSAQIESCASRSTKMSPCDRLDRLELHTIYCESNEPTKSVPFGNDFSYLLYSHHSTEL